MSFVFYPKRWPYILGGVFPPPMGHIPHDFLSPMLTEPLGGNWVDYDELKEFLTQTALSLLNDMRSYYHVTQADIEGMVENVYNDISLDYQAYGPNKLFYEYFNDRFYGAIRKYARDNNWGDLASHIRDTYSRTRSGLMGSRRRREGLSEQMAARAKRYRNIPNPFNLRQLEASLPQGAKQHVPYIQSLVGYHDSGVYPGTGKKQKQSQKTPQHKLVSRIRQYLPSWARLSIPNPRHRATRRFLEEKGILHDRDYYNQMVDDIITAVHTGNLQSSSVPVLQAFINAYVANNPVGTAPPLHVEWDYDLGKLVKRRGDEEEGGWQNGQLYGRPYYEYDPDEDDSSTDSE